MEIAIPPRLQVRLRVSVIVTVTGCPVTKPGTGGALFYVPNMEMALCHSAGPRSDLLAAMEKADLATGPDPLRIPSQRCGGESRGELLNGKAAHISRQTSEIFAYCTSRTMSIEAAAQLLSAVTNVVVGTYWIQFACFAYFTYCAYNCMYRQPWARAHRSLLHFSIFGLSALTLQLTKKVFKTQADKPKKRENLQMKRRNSKS